jgi:L-methionine (R)-S-oxide reductase
VSEEIHITATSKAERYKELLPQLKALLSNETDLTANMANVCAALKYGLNFFWVGFYLVKENELVLGPFQGPVACTRIQKGRGVCGTAWQNAQTIIVQDVEKFPGHIACSSLSKSEIVIPLFTSAGGIAGVLDVDSDELNAFDETDKLYLEQTVTLLRF